MKEELKLKHQFYLPELRRNMRNSREIGELANNVKTKKQAGSEMSNLIRKLKTHKTAETRNPIVYKLLIEN